jgi:hypothetical protein
LKKASQGKYGLVCPRKENLMQNISILETDQTADIHIKNLPVFAWRIARSASTLEGLSVAKWVAQAILEKWERLEK